MPVLITHLMGFTTNVNTCVVDHDVNMTKVFNGGGKIAANRFRVRHVDLRSRRTAPELSNHLCRLGCTIAIEIGNGYIGTLARKSASCRPTNSASGAGYYRDLVVKPHDNFLYRTCVQVFMNSL